jgi:hypothetical protein
LRQLQGVWLELKGSWFVLSVEIPRAAFKSRLEEANQISNFAETESAPCLDNLHAMVSVP